MTYLSPQRAVKTTGSDCEIRGGEYVAYDRANYATALLVWQPPADQGDPKAQTYVGEIFEKGRYRLIDVGQRPVAQPQHEQREGDEEKGRGARRQAENGSR